MARKLNQALWTQWRQRIERQRKWAVNCRVLPKGARLFARIPRLENGRFAWGRQSDVQLAGASDWQASWKRRTHVRPLGDTPLAGPASPTGATGFLQLPVSATRPSPRIELALADGTVVCLPQQNLTVLVTVLRVLRGERLEASPEDGHA